MSHDAHPGPDDRLHGAGHETDRDYVDRDVQGPPPLEREGEFVDKDVDPGAPEFTREGEFVDKDVPDDDADPPTHSYVDRDIPG
jgi:hypothetical protein